MKKRMEKKTMKRMMKRTKKRTMKRTMKWTMKRTFPGTALSVPSGVLEHHEEPYETCFNWEDSCRTATQKVYENIVGA